jgi:hypothetical protein
LLWFACLGPLQNIDDEPEIPKHPRISLRLT